MTRRTAFVLLALLAGVGLLTVVTIAQMDHSQHHPAPPAGPMGPTGGPGMGPMGMGPPPATQPAGGMGGMMQGMGGMCPGCRMRMGGMQGPGQGMMGGQGMGMRPGMGAGMGGGMCPRCQAMMAGQDAGAQQLKTMLELVGQMRRISSDPTASAIVAVGAIKDVAPEPQAAIDTLEGLLEQTDALPIRNVIHMTLKDIYLQQGDRQRALEVLRQMVLENDRSANR